MRKLISFSIRFFISLILSIIIILGLLWLSGNYHIVNAIKHTYLVGETGPTIDDYQKFASRKIESGTPHPWKLSNQYNSYSLNKNQRNIIESWETVAFLIIKNDSILYENYWDSYSSTSLTNSFSVAKSITALAIGNAIHEGKIKSIEQKVGDFIPEFSSGKKSDIRIKHLLQMSSGIDFGENYKNPFGFMAKVYYGDELTNITLNKPLIDPPGKRWHYQGGNTLLLSQIIYNATEQTLSDYVSNHLWKLIGAEQDAFWSLNDKNGIEKSFCCFYSNARDFARIGKLMLNSGKWNGVPIINESFFKLSTQAVNIKTHKDDIVDYYGLHWWLGTYKNKKFYYARGIGGQYILSFPDWDIVFVRLGRKRSQEINPPIPKDLIQYLQIIDKINQHYINKISH